jgi:hypothetical protein
MRLALLAVSLLATDALAGPCAVEEGTSMPISPPGIALPADGGILVASTTSMTSSDGGSANAFNRSWRFRAADKTEHKPTMISLAPGLVSYRPPADATGALRLVTGGSTAYNLTRTTSEEPLLAAPKVSRVRAKTAPGTRMRPGTLTVYVDLKVKPVADALGLVVLAVDDDGTVAARSWTNVTAGGKTFIVYESPKRCEMRTPAEATLAGEKVQVAYVDTKGRLSAVSKTFTVQRSR